MVFRTVHLDPDDEYARRVAGSADERARLRFVLRVMAVPILAYSLVDWLMFGPGLGFAFLGLWRVAWATVCLGLAAVAYRPIEPHTFDRIIAGFGLFSGLAATAVNWTRPHDFWANAVVDVLSVAAAYWAIPGALWARALGAFSYSLAVEGVIVFVRDVPATVKLSTLIAFAVANVLGAIVAAQMEAMRRREWLDRQRLARHGNELEVALAAARAADTAKSRLLAGVSHELRTPMNGVLGMLRLLDDTPLNPAQRDLVQTARVSAESLLGLLNDLLDTAKAEAGRLEAPAAAVFGLDEAVESAHDVVAARASETATDIDLDIHPELPRWIVGDPEGLRRILVNLLGNAVKYAAGTAVTLAARAQGDVLVVRVRDHGPGVPESFQPLLFEPFRRAEERRAKGVVGTGLGLSISRALARAAGGDLVFEPLPDGACFRLTLPLRPAPPPTGSSPAQPPTGMVLYVDADPARRARAEAVGRRAGVLVDAAAPGDAPPERPYALALVHVAAAAAAPPAAARRIVLADRADGTLPAGYDDVWVRPLRVSRLRAALGPVRVPTAAIDDRLAGVRVLVAEDHAVNRTVALRLLERWGVRAAVAVDGARAVDMARGERFDLVLMDVHMPVMDGIEATRRLRDDGGASGRDVPIVALTAGAGESDRKACMEAGMNDFLAKPFQPEALRAAVLRGLRGP